MCTSRWVLSILLFLPSLALGGFHFKPRLPRVVENIGHKTTHTVQGGVQSIGRTGKEIGKGIKGAVVDRPAAAVRQTSDTVGHINNAAQSADQTMKDLRPAIKDLDRVANNLDETVNEGKPVLARIGQAAAKIEHLSDVSEPAIANLNKVANSMDRVVQEGEPVLANIGQAVGKLQNVSDATAPMIKNVDRTARDMDQVLHQTGPMLHDIDGAAKQINRLSRSSEGLVATVNQSALRMNHLMNVSEPVVGHLKAVLQNTQALIVDTSYSIRNLTRTLGKFERTADAATLLLRGLNASLSKSHQVADHVETMVADFRLPLLGILSLIGIALCLSVFLLLAKAMLTARCMLGRRTVLRDEARPTEMSLLAGDEDNFRPLKI